jgi:hypothetical protein
MNKIIMDSLTIAESLIGTKEEGQNRGKVIDKIERLFGMTGQQYCVMFVLYCYMVSSAQNNSKFLLPETASSQTLFECAKKIGLTYTDPNKIKPGDICIFRKYKLWEGHAALINSYLNADKTFGTYEGNTYDNDFGSQREGDGIYKRIRKAGSQNFVESSFYIRGFIDIGQLYPDNQVVTPDPVARGIENVNQD